MGNNPAKFSKYGSQLRPKEIKILAKYLEKSKLFEKTSLGIYNFKHDLIDKAMNKLHEQAFPETKKYKKLHHLEDHSKKDK